MTIVPFMVSRESFDVFVILHQENLDRIKAYDPAEVMKSKMGQPWERLKLRNVLIGFATHEDMATFTEFVNAGEVKQALKFLSRGWAYRPERGDNDAQYQSEKN